MTTVNYSFGVFYYFIVYSMKRFLKYLIALLIVVVCVYGFWLWLQYKWASVIKKTTEAILHQLSWTTQLETISKSFSTTIEWEQEIAKLTPSIGVQEIIASALFKDTAELTVQWVVYAWYHLWSLSKEDILIDREWSIYISLPAPEIFWVTLTGELKTQILNIVTKEDIAMENKLREQAWELMIQEALSGNILKEAKTNAEQLLQNILLKANIQIKEVIIQEKPLQK